MGGGSRSDTSFPNFHHLFCTRTKPPFCTVAGGNPPPPARNEARQTYPSRASLVDREGGRGGGRRRSFPPCPPALPVLRKVVNITNLPQQRENLFLPLQRYHCSPSQPSIRNPLISFLTIRYSIPCDRSMPITSSHNDGFQPISVQSSLKLFQTPSLSPPFGSLPCSVRLTMIPSSVRRSSSPCPIFPLPTKQTSLGTPRSSLATEMISSCRPSPSRRVAAKFSHCSLLCWLIWGI